MNIKKVIERYNLQQKEIARILNLTEGAVSKIARGEVELKIKHAKKLGNTLGFDWTLMYKDD